MHPQSQGSALPIVQKKKGDGGWVERKGCIEKLTGAERAKVTCEGKTGKGS
jgi:hypothetical protein